MAWELCFEEAAALAALRGLDGALSAGGGFPGMSASVERLLTGAGCLSSIAALGSGAGGSAVP